MNETFEVFEVWKKTAEGFLPWPDAREVLEAVETCGDDRAEERLAVLRELVAAHRDASRMGVFNDE